MSIKDNIEMITQKIYNAEERAGRAHDSVRLMAVSKFHTIEEVQKAREAGINLFGENRVQEAVSKFLPRKEEISAVEKNPIDLHLIGSLQRNKVKIILPFVSCIQSVDRIELVDELIKQNIKNNNQKIVKVLFEVHTGEESKSGFSDEFEMHKALETLLKNATSGVVFDGFMTMAPLTDNESEIRNSFRKLITISEKFKKEYPDVSMPVISMGMSHDYEIAIEEGSTLVRIGTAIFGERVYDKK